MIDTASSDQPAATMASCCSRLDLEFPRHAALPELSLRDVEIRGRLGAGSFSVVFEVSTSTRLQVGVQLPDTALQQQQQQHQHQQSDDTCCSSSAATSVSFVSECSSLSKRSTTAKTQSHHAMKRLRADVLASNEEARQVAIQDFMLEAELLARLPVHPNIIQMTAVSQDFFENPGQGFLLLERLDETLEQLLARWEQYGRNPHAATPARRRTNRITNLFSRRQQQQHYPDPEEQQASRIALYAVGTAHAMQHLHTHNIIFRDLKPSNIGINASSGNVCLFDFGLARTVAADRLMTGAAGTVRYMAPEVALCKPYGFPADVYSFGMVLWQISLLQRPFGKIHAKEKFFHTAVELEQRPSLKNIRSHAIQHLIANCWDPNQKIRPTFPEVSQQLQAALALASAKKNPKL